METKEQLKRVRITVELPGRNQTVVVYLNPTEMELTTTIGNVVRRAYDRAIGAQMYAESQTPISGKLGKG